MTTPLISLELDGREVLVPEGSTLLEAARHAGIEIPTLCHEPALVPQAQCRLCLVTYEGSDRLDPACATRVASGMRVLTHSEPVLRARRGVLELLLARHPAACPARAQGLVCRLCDYAAAYGLEAPRLGHGAASAPIVQNGFMTTDAAACVRCAKCVRVCDEVQGVGVLAMAHRGAGNEVVPAGGGRLSATDCEMCGNCVAVCPTGAIRATHMVGLAGATKVQTTCGFCGVGCQLELNVRADRVVGVTSFADNPVNGPWLCVKGRFGYDFIHHPERLRHPLIRRNGQLERATWDEALAVVVEGLRGIRQRHGPDALGFVSSSRCTNEENYLMQKLARAGIGTHSVDQCART